MSRIVNLKSLIDTFNKSVCFVQPKAFKIITRSASILEALNFPQKYFHSLSDPCSRTEQKTIEANSSEILMKISNKN